MSQLNDNHASGIGILSLYLYGVFIYVSVLSSRSRGKKLPDTNVSKLDIVEIRSSSKVSETTDKINSYNLNNKSIPFPPSVVKKVVVNSGSGGGIALSASVSKSKANSNSKSLALKHKKNSSFDSTTSNSSTDNLLLLTPIAKTISNIDPMIKKIGTHSNEFEDIIVIGIAGGSGSGKTTLARAIYNSLGEDNISYITHDSYYKDITHLSMAEREKQNFDHPDSLDTSLLVSHIKSLKNHEQVIR